MAAILPNNSDLGSEEESEESEESDSDSEFVDALGGDGDVQVQSPSVEQLEKQLAEQVADNKKYRDAFAVLNSAGAKKQSDSDDEQKPNVASSTGVRVKQEGGGQPDTKFNRWLNRVKTEIVYAGEQDVIAWDGFDPRRTSAPQPMMSYAFDIDWSTPLSFWFVSRVMRTSRVGKLFFMPTDWQDNEQKVRAVFRLASVPHFQEGLRTAAREALPEGIELAYISAPTQINATHAHLIVNGAEQLNDDHLAATDIFVRAVRAGMDLCSYEASIRQYTTSAAAREQFALLQVRKKNELASAKQKLSLYAYDARTKQLVSKTKTTPSYLRSATGLMSWPQYKRLRQNPTIQQGLRAQNINNRSR